MPTRNVVLTDQQAHLLERLVSTGRYQNASEVLREGLRLVEQRQTEDVARLAALRAAARLGIVDFENRAYRSFDSPKDLDHHLALLTTEALSEE
jgi:antitoxin ParD1/3/4